MKLKNTFLSLALRFHKVSEWVCAWRVVMVVKAIICFRQLKLLSGWVCWGGGGKAITYFRQLKLLPVSNLVLLANSPSPLPCS